MVKIKLKNKKLFEASSTSDDLASIDLNVIKNQTISDLFNRIEQKKKVDIRKLYGGNVLKNMAIPLSKMNVPITVNTENLDTGETQVIEDFVPADVINFANLCKNYA